MPAQAAQQSFAFPRDQRVTRGTEIEHVRKAGKRVRTASFDVRAIASLRASARVGVVVPRYGRSAVDRNRLKRRLRELIRTEMLSTIPALDVILKTVPRAYEQRFDALRDEVRRLVPQLSRLGRPAEPSGGSGA